MLSSKEEKLQSVIMMGSKEVGFSIFISWVDTEYSLAKISTEMCGGNIDDLKNCSRIMNAILSYSNIPISL